MCKPAKQVSDPMGIDRHHLSVWLCLVNNTRCVDDRVIVLIRQFLNGPNVTHVAEYFVFSRVPGKDRTKNVMPLR